MKARHRHAKYSRIFPFPSAGIALSALAAGLAIVLIMVIAGPAPQNTPSHAKTASQITLRYTAAEARQLRLLSPDERARLVVAMAKAFSLVGKTGTGPVPKPGKITLAAKDFTYGFNGHFWVIASYADMLNPAIHYYVGKAEEECIHAADELGIIGRVLVESICVSAGNYLEKLADGWGWSNSHGVWVTVTLIPLRLNGGRW